MFGGTDLDKQLDKMIQEKIDQGFDETAILNNLTGGRPFEEVVGSGIDISRLQFDPKVMEEFAKQMKKMEEQVPQDELDKFKEEMIRETQNQTFEDLKEKAYGEDVDSDMEDFLASKEEARKKSESIFSKKK